MSPRDDRDVLGGLDLVHRSNNRVTKYAEPLSQVGHPTGVRTVRSTQRNLSTNFQGRYEWSLTFRLLVLRTKTLQKVYRNRESVHPSTNTSGGSSQEATRRSKTGKEGEVVTTTTRNLESISPTTLYRTV